MHVQRKVITGRRLGWILLAVMATACSLMVPRYQRPEISVIGVQWASGNLLQQSFLVKLGVQNPNDRALPVTGLHAELNVGGERWASGVSNRPFIVPAQGSIDFDMTVTANLAVALLRLSQRGDRQNDLIDYEMTGSASVDLPFLHELPFHQKGSFSLGAR